MADLRREVLKSIVPLAVLTVIVAVISKAIGGWVQAMGPMVIVIGAAMVWGAVLRAKLNREADKGNQHE